jgi:predicted NBD/HSP70 family sugar kinase
LEQSVIPNIFSHFQEHRIISDTNYLDVDHIWGMDLGGTKIEAAVLKSIGTGEVLLRKRIPTEAEGGQAHILSRIKMLVDMVAQELGESPRQIGIGAPGSIERVTGLLKNSNTVCLNGTPFLKDVQKILDIPVHMANDANCFVLAEARFGAAARKFPDAQVVFGVIMGTGVGGGVVVNGEVVHGRHGIGGEWGHNFLDASGGKCYCGKTGCVETIISGPALQRYYTSITGETCTMQEIVTRQQNGDGAARETLDRLTYFFGKAISVVINILDPDVIVIGGGVGNVDLIYTEGVASVQPWIFNDRCDTHFVRPELGDSAGVIGAALLTQ